MLDAPVTDNLQRVLPLEVVWCPPAGGACDLVIEIDPGATIAQLRTALDGRAGDLQIDGRLRAADARLATAALRRGSRIAVPGAAATPLPAEAAVELAVVGGLLAGRRFPLTPGSFVVGRSADCDIVLPAPSVSARHAVVAVDRTGGVTITDLESTNGCRVDGEFTQQATPVSPDALVQVGAVLLAVRPPQAASAPAGPRRPDGTVAFNRPPRIPLPSAPAPVRLPDAPREPAPRARLAWAAMLAPLVLGVAMAVFYDPRFALFALFSPAMMLGTWAEDRRRARRDARDGSTKVSEDVAALRGQLLQVGAEHRRVVRAVVGDPAAAVARIGSGRMWERRPGQPDFLQVAAGVGSVAWAPPVVEPQAGAAAEVAAEVAAHSQLPDAPLGLDLAGGSVTGVSGSREPAVALLRALVLQVAASHGPADVRIAVLTQPDRAHDWDWVKWLPHSAGRFGAAGGRQIATTPEQVAEVMAQVADAEAGIVTLIVVDADGLTQGREAPVRGLLGAADCAALVYARSVGELPSQCGAVIDVDGEDGKARCTHPSGAPGCDDLLLAGTESAVARDAALAMAATDDPEIIEATGQLPGQVSLLELLDLQAPTAAEVHGRWAAGGRPVVPIGMAEDMALRLDLAADGPHALIAGTTGAGKSELLRSIVAGLAATLSPDDLTFVLIDYKGGSAFDVCAQLPHTVGLVTDLDEHLGSRALHCLEAELRHRERVLREAGVSDVDEYRGRAGVASLPPLPRLLVAVDEFATLAAELPDFIDRLVSIAQRGRSLGVHLLLATQRPAGAVSDNIRANTNVRIALRVQDAADSTDVIGSAAAADLTRRLPGRGYVRLGPGEIVPFQAALVTGSATGDAPPVSVRPFGPGLAAPAAVGGGGEMTDLQLLVRATQEAFVASGRPAPRRPWPEPLPERLQPSDVERMAPDVSGVVGLADDPDRQRQVPFSFDPARGNLLLYGVNGSGPTNALAMIALAMADRDDVDLYALDAGSQALAPLAALPSVGAVVRAGERERQERLVRMLADELAARRAQVAANGALDPGATTIVVLVDNYAAFTAAFDDIAGMGVLDTFARIVADGPGLGIVTVASADRVTAVPPATAATVAQRLVFRLSDRHDYGTFGLRPADVGELPTNRAVDTQSGLHVQIAEPAGSLADAVAAVAPRVQRARTPQPIGVMPDTVGVAAVAAAADLDGEEWLLPLGIGDTALAATGLLLGPGDHALITGPARSGKSTALLALADIIAVHRPDVRLVGVALRRSPLRTAAALDAVAATDDQLADLMDELSSDAAPTVVLVDDADGVEDTAGALAQLLAQRRDDVRVIGAGRADVLRTAYGHWTAELRRSRQGLALRPNIDLDGDLWHTPLPRATRGGFPAGRGYLVADGAAELLQVATP